MRMTMSQLRQFVALLLVALGFIIQTAAQQTTGRISGVALNPSGEVLPGVQVTIARADTVGALVRTTVSDTEGRFVFSDIPPGDYRVTFEWVGFTRGTVGIVPVAAGQTRELQLRMPGTSRGAPPRPPAPGPLPENVPPAASGLAIVPVFFATDRARVAGSPAVTYGTARNPSGDLALGKFEVSIPRDHRFGSLERPDIWTFWREDPTKHLVITSRVQQSYDQFYTDVRGVVNRSTAKDAFVFIHGFNVSFEGAVFRTAQMAYDLGFDGAPILYSWPSAEALTPIAYSTDASTNDWTVPHLRWFLEDVATRTGATRVHLIAHSMGNKALVNALDRMPAGATKKFAQIVLTAPDMDADTFVQLADAIRRNGQRATLYASANDRALTASKTLQTYRRAGDTSGGAVVVPGIDTIDVSAVDTDLVGHFYYGDNASVISDLLLVLREGLPPMRRPRLRQAGAAPNQFWRFVP